VKGHQPASSIRSRSAPLTGRKACFLRDEVKASGQSGREQGPSWTDNPVPGGAVPDNLDLSMTHFSRGFHDRLGHRVTAVRVQLINVETDGFQSSWTQSARPKMAASPTCDMSLVSARWDDDTDDSNPALAVLATIVDETRGFRTHGQANSPGRQARSFRGAGEQCQRACGLVTMDTR